MHAAALFWFPIRLQACVLTSTFNGRVVREAFNREVISRPRVVERTAPQRQNTDISLVRL